MVMDVATDVGTEHVTVNDVPVHATVAAAVAAAKRAEASLISFAKERSWSEDFATAPVTCAIKDECCSSPRPQSCATASTSIYVQHTPERFEFRQVAVGQTFGNLVQVTNGLRDGDCVVVRGTDKMPRQ
jgi:hypothetical protein